jgi:phosphoribosyl 1,2-cyclic phosphate phosphodiesterase
MKVKFLGTSAGWPLPRLGCRCKVCISKDPKDARTRSQLLIDDILLLDAGIDTYHHLKKPNVDPTKIRFLAITHEHPDHTFGLWDLAHTYLSKDKGKSGHRNNVRVFIHPSTFSKIRHLFFRDEYQVQKIESGQKVKVNDLEVQLLPVQHTESSFGVSITQKGKKVFYAPDMKLLPTETFNKITEADSVIFDGSELEIKSRGHQTIKEGIQLGKKIKAKNVYFTHLGHRTLKHKNLEKFVKEKGDSRFHIAYDNLEIKL